MSGICRRDKSNCLWYPLPASTSHRDTDPRFNIFIHSVDEEGKLTCPRDNPGAIMSCRCGALFVDIDISQTVSQPVCQDLSILSPIFWSDHIAACA